MRGECIAWRLIKDDVSMGGLRSAKAEEFSPLFCAYILCRVCDAWLGVAYEYILCSRTRVELGGGA